MVIDPKLLERLKTIVKSFLNFPPSIGLSYLLKNVKDLGRKEDIWLPILFLPFRKCTHTKKPFTRFRLLTIIDGIGKKGFCFPRHPVAFKTDEPNGVIEWRQERRFYIFNYSEKMKSGLIIERLSWTNWCLWKEEEELSGGKKMLVWYLEGLLGKFELQRMFRTGPLHGPWREKWWKWLEEFTCLNFKRLSGLFLKPSLWPPLVPGDNEFSWWRRNWF